MCRVKTTEKFIHDAKIIHGDKYDYSLVEYINTRTSIKIICPVHGVFEQIPRNHLIGQKCRKCRTNYRKVDSNFIEKCIEKYGNKYDYSLVDYTGNKNKVKIICKEHGVFEQIPNNHLRGSGCPKCINYVHLKLNIGDFIGRSNEIHNNKYDYSLVDYINSKTKVKIICHTHGVFEQTPYIHTSGHGCPKCKESKGERDISKLLEMNEFKYESQKSFNGCRYKSLLFFDFYLPEYNICIEYDGKQHYEPIEFFGGEKAFNENQNRDKTKTKNKYCKDNNIILIRIRYDENINDKLEHVLNDIKTKM